MVLDFYAKWCARCEYEMKEAEEMPCKFCASSDNEDEEPTNFISKIDAQIKSPSHYKSNEFECIDEMIIVFGIDWTMIFCALNAWKYRYRAGNKSGEAKEKDLRKADEYLKFAYQLQNEPRLLKREHQE